MQYTDYDKYQAAVEGTDFSQIKKLITSIGSIETDFNNQIDIDANWDSIVKEALINKLANFKTEFRKLALETTNLSNIDLCCKDLKDKIIEYKRLYTEINGLDSKITKAKNDSKLSEIAISDGNGNLTYVKNDLFESSEVINLKNQQSAMKKNFTTIQQDIESLIKKIKAIEFNKSSGAYQSSTAAGSTAQIGANGMPLGNIDASVLTAAGSGEYNGIFQNQLEQPIKTTISALQVSQIGLRNSASLASIVATNMPGTTDENQLFAIALANLLLPKINDQIAQGDLALEQQNELLARTRALNTNKFLFGRDGEIRELAVARDKEKDPKKIKEYNDKIEAAIAKFNAENTKLIPVGQVMAPVLTSTVSSSSQITSSAKETEVLSLFTESLYNSPPPDTTMSKITDANGNVSGYQIVDNRIESSPQTYTVNVASDGYQLSIGGKESYFYPQNTGYNGVKAVADLNVVTSGYEVHVGAEVVGLSQTTIQTGSPMKDLSIVNNVAGDATVQANLVSKNESTYVVNSGGPPITISNINQTGGFNGQPNIEMSVDDSSNAVINLVPDEQTIYTPPIDSDNENNY